MAHTTVLQVGNITDDKKEAKVKGSIAGTMNKIEDNFCFVTLDGSSHLIPVNIILMSPVLKKIMDEASIKQDPIEKPEPSDASTAADIICDTATGGGVLSEITGPVLKRVMEWCDAHRIDAIDEDTLSNLEFDDEETRLTRRKRFADIEPWDDYFINHLSIQMLRDLMLASEYLQLHKLVTLCAKAVANMIKSHSVEEVRQMFHIENDYSREEERELKAANDILLGGN